MILVVLTHAWNVSHNWNTKLLQNLRVTDTRALEDLRRSESTSCDNDEFSGFDSFVDGLGQGEFGLVLGVGLVLNSDGAGWRGFIEYDPDDL